MLSQESREVDSVPGFPTDPAPLMPQCSTTAYAPHRSVSQPSRPQAPSLGVHLEDAEFSFCLTTFLTAWLAGVGGS